MYLERDVTSFWMLERTETIHEQDLFNNRPLDLDTTLRLIIKSVYDQAKWSLEAD